MLPNASTVTRSTEIAITQEFGPVRLNKNSDALVLSSAWPAGQQSPKIIQHLCRELQPLLGAKTHAVEQVWGLLHCRNPEAPLVKYLQLRQRPQGAKTPDLTGMPKQYFMRLFSFETMPRMGDANPRPAGEKREHSGRQEHSLRPVPACEEDSCLQVLSHGIYCETVRQRVVSLLGQEQSTHGRRENTSSRKDSCARVGWL